MTDTSREATFKQILYIWYPVRFRWKNNKDKNKDVRALINLGSKVKVMYPTYATKLGLCTRKIDVGPQKINGSHLDTFEIVITDC